MVRKPFSKDPKDPQIVTTGNEVQDEKAKVIADKSELKVVGTVRPQADYVTETLEPGLVIDRNTGNVVKLDGSDAKKILKEYDSGSKSPQEVADSFNVSPAVVNEIIDYRTRQNKEDK